MSGLSSGDGDHLRVCLATSIQPAPRHTRAESGALAEWAGAPPAQRLTACWKVQRAESSSQHDLWCQGMLKAPSGTEKTGCRRDSTVAEGNAPGVSQPGASRGGVRSNGEVPQGGVVLGSSCPLSLTPVL